MREWVCTFTHIDEGAPQGNSDYLLEGGPIVVQASPTRWVFQEPICISVPAGVVVRGCIWLPWFFFKILSVHLPISWMSDLWAYLPTPRWVFSSFGQNNITLVPNHPYSPNPTLSNYSLFPQMKKVLKGKHFANVEEVKQKMTEALKGIKIDKFKNCFEQWKKRLNRCIASNGEYFESDWSLNM